MFEDKFVGFDVYELLVGVEGFFGLFVVWGEFYGLFVGGGGFYGFL